MFPLANKETEICRKWNDLLRLTWPAGFRVNMITTNYPAFQSRVIFTQSDFPLPLRDILSGWLAKMLSLQCEDDKDLLRPALSSSPLWGGIRIKGCPFCLHILRTSRRGDRSSACHHTACSWVLPGYGIWRNEALSAGLAGNSSQAGAGRQLSRLCQSLFSPGVLCYPDSWPPVHQLF